MSRTMTNSHNPNTNSALEFNQMLRDSTQTTMLYTSHFLTRKPKGALFQRGPSCSSSRGELSQDMIKPYSRQRNSFASSLSRYTAGDWLGNRETTLTTPNAQYNAQYNSSVHTLHACALVAMRWQMRGPYVVPVHLTQQQTRSRSSAATQTRRRTTMAVDIVGRLTRQPSQCAH